MKKTARELGRMVGLDSREVNKKLAEYGFLKGNPGAWALTEKGAQHGEIVYKSNGYGGFAARSWDFIVWDDDIVNILGNPEKHLREVNKNRKIAGLPAIKSWDEK